MTKQSKINLLNGTYNKANLQEASVARLVNLYIEEYPNPISDNMKSIATDSPIAATYYTSKLACMPTPGTAVWTDLSAQAVGHRGCINHKEIGYWAIGPNVYRTTSSGVSTLLGTLPTNQGPVSIAALNDFVVFVDGSQAWYWQLSTSTWAQITTGNLPTGCSKILALSEFIVYFQPNSNLAWVSAISDPTTILGTSFFANSLEPDNLISGIVANEIMYLMGTYHTEPWYVSGGATIPFDHTSQNAIEFGIAAPNACINVNGTAYWLARTKQGIQGCYFANLASTGIIADRNFVSKVNSFDNINDCFFWSESYDQHIFINMTFPTAIANQRGYTFSYDLSTGKFSEKEYFNQNNINGPTYDCHFGACSMALGRQQLIGDTVTGKIFLSATNLYDDNGQQIRRILIGNNITGEANQIIYLSELELHVNRGIGRVSGNLQATNPTIDFYLSKDGGNTFGGPRSRQCSLTGQYNKRLLWSGNGGARILTPMFQWSCAAPIVIVAATATIR